MKAIPILFLGSALACLGQSQLVRETSEVLLQKLAKRSATHADQLGQWGGRQGIESFLARVEKEGGESALARLTQLADELGWASLNGLKHAPQPILQALDHLPAQSIRPALWALEREGPVLAELVRAHGAAVLEFEVRNPGLAAAAFRQASPEFVAVASSLSPQAARLMATHGAEMAPLPIPIREKLALALKNTPDELASYLERHPKALASATLASATLVAVHHLTAPDQEIEVRPDGTVITRTGSALKSMTWRIVLPGLLILLGFNLYARLQRRKNRNQ